MRWLAALLGLLGLLAATSAAADPPWDTRKIPLLAQPVSLSSGSDSLHLALADGSNWLVEWDIPTGRPVLTEDRPEPTISVPGIIPDGRVAVGSGLVHWAWLAEPTDQYPHGILGDEIEATTLVVETRDGTKLQAKAPDDSVFEDLQPRLWDLDQDGEPEVWVIRADHRVGARLEAYGVVNGALMLRYSTAPIGRGFRWLNPIGIADFTGQGIPELALVITPHIGGVLTLYRINGDQLKPVLSARSFSNHAIGSRELGLSWVGDIDGDGLPDILLPGPNRQSLQAVSLARAEPKLIAQTGYFPQIQTSLTALPLADGSRVILFADESPALRWLHLPARP